MKQKCNIDLSYILPILVLFMVLAFFRLGFYSLWLDEIMSLDFCDAGVSELFQSLVKDVHAPLFYMLLFIFIKLGGLSEMVGRLPALLAGCGTVLALFYFARELKLTRKCATIVCLFLAVSPFFIEYSREVHPYSLSALFSVLSWLYFIRILKKGRLSDTLLYALSSGFLLLTFYMGFLVIASQFLHSWLYRLSRRKRKRLFTGWLGAGVVFCPWLPVFTHQLLINKISHDVEVYFPEGIKPEHAVRLVGDIFLGTAGRFLGTAIITLIMLVVAVFGLWMILRTRRRKKLGRFRAIELVWPFWSLVILFTLSGLLKPLYLSRYMTMSAPFAALFIAAAVSFTARPLKFFLIAIVLAWSLYSYTGYIQSMPRQNWKEPAQHLVKNALEKDVILTDRNNVRSCLVYYFKILERGDLYDNVFTFKEFRDLTGARYPYRDRTLWHLGRDEPWCKDQLAILKEKNDLISQIPFRKSTILYSFRAKE